LHSRVDKLVERFDEFGIDGFLLVPPPQTMNSIPNVFYLTGFTGSNAVLIITAGRRLFLTDTRYVEMAQANVKGFEVIENTTRPLHELFPELNKDLGITKLGVESATLSLALYNKWKDAFAPVELVPTEGAVEKLRMLKDEYELEAIRNAIRVNEETFRHLLGCIKDGVRENEIAAEFEYQIRKRGAKMASFPPIIASGTNSSMPHAGYTTQEIVPGAPFTIDIGVVYDGYCSDMTRTVFFKDCPKVWRDRYEAVLDAKNAATAYAKAGMTGNEVDAIARSLIEGRGFTEHCYTHGLGHSVGIQIHEAPRFAKGNEDIVPAGCVMSIEPGIYVPGEGGIRIEDLVLVQENGLVNLNSLGTELTVVG